MSDDTPVAGVDLPFANSDDKYITFKRADLLNMLNGLPVHPLLDSIEIRDAVVIRRQDYFASPALATYASMIGISLHMVEDEKRRSGLMAVADYFQRQSEFAADEGWKFPDI